MRKITKKEFLEALMKGESTYVGLAYRKLHDQIQAPSHAEGKKRTVTKKASNHLEFSDGSRLYFDSFADRKYYNEGRYYLVDIHETGCNFAKVIAYYI